MSLIKERVLLTEKDKIINANTTCLNSMKSSAKVTFDLFWNNRNKTAQEVCDLFGTDAEKAFDLHSKLQTLIYEIDNSWIPLVPLFPYTVNADGSLTINYPPPPVVEEPTEEPEEELIP